MTQFCSHLIVIVNIRKRTVHRLNFWDTRNSLTEWTTSSLLLWFLIVSVSTVYKTLGNYNLWFNRGGNSPCTLPHVNGRANTLWSGNYVSQSCSDNANELAKNFIKLSLLSKWNCFQVSDRVSRGNLQTRYTGSTSVLKGGLNFHIIR